MSDKYFFVKFSNTLLDILDQIQTEQYPSEVENGKVVSEKWAFKDFMNFFVGMYFKYIKLLRDCEDSYDQTVHPQLRKYIKKFVENLLCRLVQVKKEMIFYNNPILYLPGIPYIFLDDYIVDLKLEPRDLELVIPKYFRENDSILTKKRRILVDKRLIEFFGDDYPEEDIFPGKYFNVNLEFEQAIRILQNLEMGRQATQRVDKLLKRELASNSEVISDEEQKKLIFDNLIAIYKLRKSKFDEMEFINMIPNEEDIIENSKDNNKLLAKNIRQERKRIQANNLEYYEVYKEEMKNNFKKVEEDDIKENMKNERREWISNQIMFNDKSQGPPYDIKFFYERNNVEKKEVLDENQIKQAENIAKDKLKQKQDNKKKDEAGQMIKCSFLI